MSAAVTSFANVFCCRSLATTLFGQALAACPALSSTIPFFRFESSFFKLEAVEVLRVDAFLVRYRFGEKEVAEDILGLVWVSGVLPVG